MPVYLGEYDTEPKTEGKLSIPLRCESIATIFSGLLKENGEECIDHHKPSEREKLEGAHQKSDRRQTDLKRRYRRMKLVSWVSVFVNEFGRRWWLTSSERLVAGTILAPKRNVATLCCMKDFGFVGYPDPPSRSNPVSSRNRKTSTSAKPWTPTVHQNSIGQSTCPTMKPPNIGPATVPNRKLSEKARNALPRSCRKKRSVIVLAPSMDGTDPNIPAKSRDMTKGLYWFDWVIEAAQMLHATAPIRLHQIVEHLPMIFVRGTKKSGPKVRPATAAEIYTESVSHLWRSLSHWSDQQEEAHRVGHLS